MGIDKFPLLYWFYLIIAIIASSCSIAYWVMHYSRWWKRRQRQHARRLRSLAEQRDKLVRLERERGDLATRRADVEHQLESAGTFARLFRRRLFHVQLKDINRRESELDAEIHQLQRLLAEAEGSEPD